MLLKRLAVIILAPLYLLISSGWFVCAIHCSTAKIISVKSVKACCPQHRQKEKSKQDCCKKHTSFTVKENLKPGAAVKLYKPSAILLTKRLYLPLVNVHTKTLIADVANTNGPPWRTGRMIVIQFHSFLI